MSSIYVTRTSMPSKEEYFKEISDLWDTHFLTNMGQKHQMLERELKEYLRVKELSLFCNGHMALELLLQVMELSGEVITTPFTFASTTHAIVRNGLVPVFCDINEDDYTIDVNKIESLITEKTSAILPVHVYGNICDVEAIDEIARKHHIKVIYDAAHAFGVTYKGQGAAAFGDASMLSFHATKVFNTIEGGAVCFKDAAVGEKLYQLKNFGIQSETEVTGVGVNAKMNEFQAAMGLCNLRHIDEEIAKRKRVFERYMENLGDIAGIKVPYKPQSDFISNYAYFPVIFDEAKCGCSRDDLYDELRKCHIFARKYFYPLTNTFSCFEGQFDVQKTPTALWVSERVLCLPMYADLELDDVNKICSIICRRIKGSRGE